MTLVIKRIPALLCAFGLTVSLSGCFQEEPVQTEERPTITVPTVDKTQSPGEMLHAALAQAQTLEAYAIDYVINTAGNRYALSGQLKKQEDGSWTAWIYSCSFTQDGTTENEVERFYQGQMCYELVEGTAQSIPTEGPQKDPERILKTVQLPGDVSAMIDGLADRTLHAIPQYDGSMVFQVENLPPEEFVQLVYGTTQPTTVTAGEVNAIRLTIAPEGHLSGVEYTTEGYQLTLNCHLIEDVQTPEWIN